MIMKTIFINNIILDLWLVKRILLIDSVSMRDQNHSDSIVREKTEIKYPKDQWSPSVLLTRSVRTGLSYEESWYILFFLRRESEDRKDHATND